MPFQKAVETYRQDEVTSSHTMTAGQHLQSRRPQRFQFHFVDPNLMAYCSDYLLFRSGSCIVYLYQRVAISVNDTLTQAPLLFFQRSWLVDIYLTLRVRSSTSQQCFLHADQPHQRTRRCDTGTNSTCYLYLIQLRLLGIVISQYHSTA